MSSSTEFTTRPTKSLNVYQLNSFLVLNLKHMIIVFVPDYKDCQENVDWHQIEGLVKEACDNYLRACEDQFRDSEFKNNPEHLMPFRMTNILPDIITEAKGMMHHLYEIYRKLIVYIYMHPDEDVVSDDVSDTVKMLKITRSLMKYAEKLSHLGEDEAQHWGKSLEETSVFNLGSELTDYIDDAVELPVESEDIEWLGDTDGAGQLQCKVDRKDFTMYYFPDPDIDTSSSTSTTTEADLAALEEPNEEDNLDVKMAYLIARYGRRV